MTDIDPLKITSQMIATFESVKSAMEKAKEDQDFCDREYNDLTHGLELINFNAYEGYKLAKQLQNNRIRRRILKNTVEQLQPLYELFKKNQGFFKELKNVQAQISTIRDIQQKRIYTPRARTDLQEAFNKANGVKSI